MTFPALRKSHLFLPLMLAFCQCALSQVVIIANPGVKATELSTADLRDVFSGSLTGIKGASQLVPVLLKGGPAHDDMLTLYIQKSDSAFRATWRSLVFSGQGVLPRTLDSEGAVVDYVAHTPGAIGYVGKTTPHDHVKTLTVK